MKKNHCLTVVIFLILNYSVLMQKSGASTGSEIIFEFSTTVQPGVDQRELAVAFHSIKFIDSTLQSLGQITFGTTEANVLQGEGWFGNESWPDIGTFQWTGGDAKMATIQLNIPETTKGILLKIRSIIDSLCMTVAIDGDTVATLRVDANWHSGYVPIGEINPEPVHTTEPVWIEGCYFPHFPSTDRIFVITAETELENHSFSWKSDFRINRSYKTMMSLTLVGMQGIINRQRPEIYLDYRNVLSDIGRFWMPYLEEHVEIVDLDLDHLSAVNFLIRRYSSRFSGAVIYDPEVPETINLATMIAGLEDRIILAPEQLQLPGIPSFDSVNDLRQLVQEKGWNTSEESKYDIYQWVYENLWERLEHRIIGAISPGPPTSQESRSGNYYPLVLAQRDLYIALRLPALWLDPRDPQEAELFGNFLEEAPSPIPVMGVSPDEVSTVKFISGFGDWTPALSWPNAPLSAGNLSVFSGIRPVLKMYQPQIDKKKILATLDGQPIVTIWCSDGDNLHYQMDRGFHDVTARWIWERVQGNHFGWTTNPVLANIAPVIWNYYIDTRDKVSLISGLSGGGYTYPRSMTDEQLQNYLGYTSTYLNETGLKTIYVDSRGGLGNWDERLADEYFNGLHNTGFLGTIFGDVGWPWGLHFNYQNQPIPAVQQAYLLHPSNQAGIIGDIMNSKTNEVFMDLADSIPWFWDSNIPDSYPWHRGEVIQDIDADGGKTLYFSNTNPDWNLKVWGPFATLAPGKYNAVFRLKTSDNQSGELFTQICAGRKVYDGYNTQWQFISTRDIAPNDFHEQNEYQDFNVEFTLPDFTNDIEFRLSHNGAHADLFADYICVTKQDSLSLPLFIPILIVVARPYDQTDNLRLFIENFENQGGLVLTPEEFSAALNPEYMIQFAAPILGEGDTNLVESKTQLIEGNYFKSLLTTRNALKEAKPLVILEDSFNTECNIDLIINVLENDYGSELSITDISILPDLNITDQGDGNLHIEGIATEHFSFYYAVTDDDGKSDSARVQIYVTIPEEIWYDGINSNCDGADDYDQDNDGYIPDDYIGIYSGKLPFGDCDDKDEWINPSAEDKCDHFDNNCDGIVDNAACADLLDDVSAGFDVVIKNEEIRFTPVSLSACDPVSWSFSGATVYTATSMANEAVMISFDQISHVEACMTVLRYYPDGNTCSETYCYTITSTREPYTDLIRIYPIPASNKLIVELPERFTGQTLSMHVEDLIGRKLIQKKLNARVEKNEIDLSSLPQGLFLLILRDVNGHVIVHKFVKY